MRRNASSPLTPDEAYKKAATLCSQAEHCSTDIREKLTRWGISVSDADNILLKLTREKYIDEKRYAKAFTNDRLKYSHWGRIKIQANLRQLRIPGSVIHEALETIDQDEYFQVLEKTLQEKRDQLGGVTDQDTKNKIIRFALQRGFEMDEIMKKIN